MKTSFRDLLAFVVMTVAVFFFWRDNTFLTIILFVEFLILWNLYTRNKRIFFIISGLFGIFLETIGGYIGIWRYVFPNFLTVPFWIFFCWGFTFQLLKSVYSRFLEKSI